LAIVAGSPGLLVISKTWGLFDTGTVSVVERTADRKWVLRPFLELTGSLRCYRVRSDGGIDIATTVGTLVVDPAGHVDRFDCDEIPLEPPASTLGP
jgi:hypothetical protein